LTTQRHPLQHKRAAEQLRVCERLWEADKKLPAVLNGVAKAADVTQLLDFAQICQRQKRRYAAAAGFYRDAFARDPQLANDLIKQRRYNAACSAALAASGQSEDANELSDDDRTALRSLALTWLRADLDAYRAAINKQPEKKPTVRQRLGHWQVDSDLNSVRDKTLLEMLPKEESLQWGQLWSKVGTLLSETAEKN
jgi:hypothetical protein